MTTDPGHEALFLELVLVFQQTAWAGLGKIQNPYTGKIEVDLKAASHAIDMLAMLKARTAATLSQQERSLLDNALTQLRLNFVEAAAEASAAPKAQAGADPGQDDADTGEKPRV